MKSKKIAGGRWLADLRVSGEGARLICETKKDADGLVAHERDRLVAWKSAASQGRTVAEAARLFLDQRRARGCSPATVGNYERMLRIHIVPRLPEYLGSLAAADLREIRYRPAELLPAIKRARSSLLGAVLDAAEAEGWIQIRPGLVEESQFGAHRARLQRRDRRARNDPEAY